MRVVRVKVELEKQIPETWDECTESSCSKCLYNLFLRDGECQHMQVLEALIKADKDE